MATMDYFKRDSQTSLPKSISQSTIDAVNREVLRISSTSQSDEAPKMQGEYIKITAKDRATIGEYAAKNGIAAAIRHFKQNRNFRADGKMRIARNYNLVENVVQTQLKPKSYHRNIEEGLFYLVKN